MAIPVFTGRVGLDRPAADAPIESVSLEGFERGARLGAAIPSTATAVARGVEGAVQNFQQGQQFSEESDIRQQRLSDMQQQSALEQTLAPLRVEAFTAQKRAAESKAQTELLEQQAIRNESTIASQSRNTVLGAFTSIQNGDVAGGIQALNQNYVDLLKSGRPVNDKGIPVTDPVINGLIMELPYYAAKTGDPAIQAQAKELVDKYLLAANNNIAASKGKSMSSGGGAGSPGVISDRDSLLERAGILPSPQERQEPSQFGTPAAPQAPTQQQSPTQYSRPQQQVGRDLEFPGKEAFPAAPPALDESQAVDTPSTAVVDRLVGNTETPQERVDREYAKIKAQSPGMSDDQAQKAAERRVRMSGVGMTPKQEVDYAKGIASLDKIRTNAGRARTALDRLGSLMETTSIDPAMGAGTDIMQFLNTVEAQGGDQEKREAGDIKKELTAIANDIALTDLASAGFGTQAINTKDEREIRSALSFGGNVSREQAAQALEILEGKFQLGIEQQRVIDAFTSANKPFSEANRAFLRYKLANPATNIGRINGKPFVTRNLNRTSVDDFITQTLGIPVGGRDDEGRVIEAEPAYPGDLSERIGEEARLGRMSFSPAQDVPLVQNGANEATIRRLIMTESSGNPNAVGKAGEKGLGQFLDTTGKEIWDQLYPGEKYDPFNPQRNTEMTTYYFNNLLNKYDGNTKLAAAAYNWGMGNVDGLLNKLYNGPNPIYSEKRWSDIEKRLPESTRQYVKKIVDGGENETQIVRTPTPQEQDNAFASLLTDNAKNNARTILTGEGVQALAQTAAVKTPEEAEGSWLGEGLKALLGVQEAQAESPEGGERSVPGEEGAGVISTLNGIIPDKLKSFALGATRGALLAFDDEAMVPLRMLVTGEDADTALTNIRAVQEEFKAANPGWFTAGEIGGGVGTGLATGGATTIAKAPTVVNTVKSAAKAGAVFGTITGAGAGEGGFTLDGLTSRAKSAVGYGAAGAVTGGAFGAGYKAVSATLNSKVVDNALSKLWASTGGKGRPVFTKPEQAALKTLDDIAKDDTALKATQDKLRALGSTEEATALDILSDPQARAAIRQMAQDPAVAQKMTSDAGTKLQNQNSRLIEAITPKGQVLNTADDVTAAATGVKKTLESIDKEAKAVAKPLYQQAQEELSVVNTKYKKTPKNAAVPTDETVFFVDKSGNTVGEDGTLVTRWVGGAIPQKPVKAYTSDDVLELATGDSQVLDAIQQAHAKIDPKHVMPSNSFDILQLAGSIMRKNSVAAGEFGKKREYSQSAYQKLKAAMYKETPSLEKADDAWVAALGTIKESETQLLTKLEKFSDRNAKSNAADFNKTLFAADADAIKGALSRLPTAEQEQIRTAARSHLVDLASGRGETATRKASGFPDLTKKGLDKKIEAVFGEEEGQRIISKFAGEEKIAGTAKAVRDEAIPASERTKRGLELADTRSLNDIGQTMAAIATSNPAWAAGLTARTLGKLKVASGIRNSQEVSEGIRKILYDDPENAVQFLGKVREQLAADKGNKVLQNFDSMLQKLAKNNDEIASTVGKIAGIELASKAEFGKGESKGIKTKQFNDRLSEVSERRRAFAQKKQKRRTAVPSFD